MATATVQLQQAMAILIQNQAEWLRERDTVSKRFDEIIRRLERLEQDMAALTLLCESVKDRIGFRPRGSR